MGENEPFLLQIVLPEKVIFTGTSGKNTFTGGKPGLPEQRFTTLLTGIQIYIFSEITPFLTLDIDTVEGDALPLDDPQDELHVVEPRPLRLARVRAAEGHCLSHRDRPRSR